jgi:hypothetical protein
VKIRSLISILHKEGLKSNLFKLLRNIPFFDIIQIGNNIARYYYNCVFFYKIKEFLMKLAALKYAIVMTSMFGFASSYAMENPDMRDVLVQFNNQSEGLIAMVGASAASGSLSAFEYPPSGSDNFYVKPGIKLNIYGNSGFFVVGRSGYGNDAKVYLSKIFLTKRQGDWVRDQAKLIDFPLSANTSFIMTVNPDGSVTLEPKEANVEVLDANGRPDGRPLVQPKIYRFLGVPVAATAQQILGIRQTATKDEARQAYKILSKRFHPDLNKASEASDAFKLLAWAHAKLTE